MYFHRPSRMLRDADQPKFSRGNSASANAVPRVDASSAEAPSRSGGAGTPASCSSVGITCTSDTGSSTVTPRGTPGPDITHGTRMAPS